MNIIKYVYQVVILKQREKGFAYQIVKKIKEINGIKDKINEVSNITLQYEKKTYKIIKTIEKKQTIHKYLFTC